MNGLTLKEINESALKFGKNILPVAKETPLIIQFLQQFKSVLVVLLIVACIVSFYLGEIVDGVFILIIVVLNAGIGFFQEFKAKKELDALKKMVSTQARVIRDGKEDLVETTELVVGDIVVLSDGDKVPVDGEILDCKNLQISEASLTGESVPVDKAIGDTVFLSSVVLSGRAVVKTTSVGVKTKFGQVALSLSEITDEKTPLEIQIESLGWRLTILVGLIIIVISLADVANGRKLTDVFISSVALAVAAIPEGLPAVLTIALAVGVKRMSAKKAVIKRLVATEALGSVDVICTDKTGTLTKNEMTVVEFLLANKKYNVTGVGYNGDGVVENLSRNEEVVDFFNCALLCNTSGLAPVEGNKNFVILGDTTEGALLVLGKKAGFDYESIRNSHKILDEISFDGTRKMMTMVTSEKIYCKGAPEKILELCKNLQNKDSRIIREQIDSWAKKGYRVLALASKDYSKQKRVEWENGLNFQGVVAIFDPPREEVRRAIESSHLAGIRVIMLTGDSVVTAKAIGEQIGLIEKGEEVISGEQLSEYSDEVLHQSLEKVRIFARVSPNDKLRIVTALQNLGKVVAVTGDGVNDAPALKKAQVGVAMGITGTDVAKEAADLVITDDNFSSIVSAVEQGRIIFLNLVKAISYLLSCNFGEVTIIFGAILLHLPMPLSPIAILWMNLVTDGLPALALSIDTSGSHILAKNKKDLGLGESLLSIRRSINILTSGLVFGSLALVIYLSSLKFGLDAARLSVFTFLVIGEFVMAFIVRGRHQNIMSNKLLWIAIIFGVVSQTTIIFIPVLKNLFLLD